MNLDETLIREALDETQRTLLRFAVHLGVPILVDSSTSPEAGKELIAHLRAIGADTMEAETIGDLDHFDKYNPTYIVLTLHNK